jgi:hypothetical protein
MISYYSPLLAVHLEWLLKSGSRPLGSREKDPDAKVQMEIQDNSEGELSETSVDIQSQQCNAIFGVTCGYATAVFRWLRLTTLHMYCIESLINTSTASKLRTLEIRLIITSLPDENREIANKCA